jgi:hypothetical protein
MDRERLQHVLTRARLPAPGPFHLHRTYYREIDEFEKQLQHLFTTPWARSDMDRKDKQSSYGASSQSSSTMRATPQPSPTVRLPPRFGTSIFVNGTKPNSPFAANSPSTPLASIKKEEGMSASPKEGERFAHDQIIE